MTLVTNVKAAWQTAFVPSYDINLYVEKVYIQFSPIIQRWGHTLIIINWKILNAIFCSTWWGLFWIDTELSRRIQGRKRSNSTKKIFLSRFKIQSLMEHQAKDNEGELEEKSIWTSNFLRLPCMSQFDKLTNIRNSLFKKKLSFQSIERAFIMSPRPNSLSPPSVQEFSGHRGVPR